MENKESSYYLDIENDMLSYLEEQGKQTIIKLDSSNRYNKQSAKTIFNLLLSGAGGSLLLLLSSNKLAFHYQIGLASAIVLWGTIAIYLLLSVITPNKKFLGSNVPGALYHSLYKEDWELKSTKDWLSYYGYTSDNKLGALRRIELVNLDKTANELIQLNTYLAKHLKRTMLLSIISPVIILVITLFSFS